MFPSFTASGLIRYLKLKIVGKDIIITGSCNQCGSCCQRLNLDVKGSWISSARQFNRLVQDNPDYERFKIIGRDRHGFLEFTCSWLQDNGTCLDYKNRLNICANFPNKNMFFMNGVLPLNCGYKAEVNVPFEKILKKTLKNTSRDNLDY